MNDYDVIIIGSGFGGALAAYPLVHAGRRVLMIERGGWVERGPQNWAPEGVRDLSPHYDKSTGTVHCVGGPSVFYGGVSLRYRERDFESTAEEMRAGAKWPYDYNEIEPYYAAAERIIGVAGKSGDDPTEPYRSAPYPGRLPPLSRIGRRLWDAAEAKGHHPFRLPLAINYAQSESRGACIRCSTCDGYPCAIAAKNDMASSVLPGLIARGMTLIARTAVTGIITRGSRAVGVRCVDLQSNKNVEFTADDVIVSAGALATPQILLASGLDRFHESGAMIGRNLMRHCNAIVFGIFPERLDAAREFHKQMGVNDLYFGAPEATPRGKLGTIQQIHAPPIGLVRSELPGPLGHLGSRILGRMTGLIVIATDEPQYENRVEVGNVRHRYSKRDLAARRVLINASKRILSEAGALTTFSMPIKTFSHALGSVRMGVDERSPLDGDGRLRGLENVYVSDGSALATSAGVNPSLTIAATALRTGCKLAGVGAPQAQPQFISLTHGRGVARV